MFMISPGTTTDSNTAVPTLQTAARHEPALLPHLLSAAVVFGLATPSAQTRPPAVATPTDVKPGSITCEDVPYPYPVSYLPLTLYGQDVRIAFMDVAPPGPANGHTVVLFHGNNFAGFYFGSVDRGAAQGGLPRDRAGSDRLRPVVEADHPRTTSTTWRGTHSLILQSLKIDKAMIVGHSMGGMLAARFATQFPASTERLVLYNPIGLVDGRYDRPLGQHGRAATSATLASDLSDASAPASCATSRTTRRRGRPSSRPTRAIRYAWTLSADWPRLAMVQTLINQVQYLDRSSTTGRTSRRRRWCSAAPTDSLPGSAAVFRERMKFVADDASPTARPARLQLLPGLGHVPHMEAPDQDAAAARRVPQRQWISSTRRAERQTTRRPASLGRPS